MKKVAILIGVFLIILGMVFHNNKQTVRGLVLYKSEVSNYNSLKNDLKKEIGVNLKIDYLIDEYDIPDNYDLWKYTSEQLTNKLNTGNIDLLLDVPNEYLRDHIENKNLLKLDKFLNNDNIYPAIIDKSKKIGNGNIYFISPYFQTNFIMINTDIFNQLDVPVPKEIKSWDNVLDILSDVKSSIIEKNKDIYPLSLGMNGIESFFQDFEVLTRNSNIPIKSNNNIYEDEKWVDIFSFFMTLYRDYGIHDEIYTPELFIDDKIAVKFVQGSEIDMYKDSMKKFKVFEVPSYKDFKDEVYLQTVDVSIPSNSKHIDSTLKVLNYFFSEEFNNKSIDEPLFGMYPFVSYIDNKIIEKYEKKYKLDNPSVIYSDKPGYANKHEFVLFDDYAAFQQSSREVIPNIINKSTNVKDGLNDINKKYLEYLK